MKRCAACASAVTTRAKSTPPTKPPSNIRAAQRSSRAHYQRLRPRRSWRRQERHPPAEKLNEEELQVFRSRFGIPLNDQDCVEVPFYRPAEDSIEIQYLRARREALGGYVPKRSVRSQPLVADHDELFKEFYGGSEGREVSTTMAYVGMLRKMLRDPEIGKLIVPIVRTKRVPSAWNRSFAPLASIPASARNINRSTSTP